MLVVFFGTRTFISIYKTEKKQVILFGMVAVLFFQFLSHTNQSLTLQLKKVRKYARNLIEYQNFCVSIEL